MALNNRQPQRFTPYQSYRAQAARQRAVATHNRYSRITLAYAAVTALCLVFCAVYEIFSFGEHSDVMRMMFMIPLLGGAAPFGLMAVSENPPSLSRVASNLWNSGLAVHASGCLIRGIIEISGRICDYDLYYWVTGMIFLTLAAVIQVAAWRSTGNKSRNRRYR